MLHFSKLGEFAEKFPRDTAGYVPVQGDCWRQMKFDDHQMDPEEEGISAEERARRIEYLDKEWWPQVLAKTNDEKQRLEEIHGETFISHWERVVNRSPDEPHGFEVA